MDFDLRKVAEHVRAAKTEDLLDRVTVYREDMEPAAVDLMENELARRKITPEQIAAHERERRAAALTEPDGFVKRCAFCDRPAVTRAWTTRRPHGAGRLAAVTPLVWVIALFRVPLRLNFCEVHAKEAKLA